MRILWTLYELLALRSNGWTCRDCGRTWGDLAGPQAAVLIAAGNPDCPHRQLHRSQLAPA